MKKLILLLLLIQAGCGFFAVTFAPNKTAARSNSEKAGAANMLFFSTLHAGRYEEIPSVLAALQAAYLENPNDPELASHIAFAHIWQLAERYRSDQNIFRHRGICLQANEHCILYRAPQRSVRNVN